jgi:putative chitinase
MDLNLGFTQHLINESKRYGLLRNQCAYLLATAYWETAHTMKPVVEAFWLSEEWRKTHLRYYPWHGRGFVQLTWKENYEGAAKKLGIPLDRNPALALDAPVAAQIIVQGMKEGWFSGHKLSDYITLQKSDFVNARRIINGTDKAKTISHIAAEYDLLLKRAGYGMGSPADAVRPVTAPVTPRMPDPSPAASAGPQEGTKPDVVVVEGKPNESQVVIVKNPQNPPATHPLPSNGAGFAAFGAMIIAAGYGVLKYLGVM